MKVDRHAKRVRFTREGIRFSVTPYGVYTYVRDSIFGSEYAVRIPGYMMHKHMVDIDRARRVLKTR